MVALRLSPVVRRGIVRSCFLGMLLTSCAAGALAAEAPGAGSDVQIDEVIVTANKSGAASVQRTPIAVTALSADALGAAHVSDVRDLGQLVPNLSVSRFSTYAQIYIRGVGSNNSFNGSDPSVTVHADGVYLARPFAQFSNFLDVQRVEVLRGPQGLLYGRNSVGGTINIISRKPTDDFAARASALVGNYSLVDLGGFVSGPLIPERLEASLAASYVNHDPYRKNIVASGNDVDDEDSRAVRGQLRAQLSDAIEATTRADYARSEQRLAGFSVLQAPFDAATNSILGNYHRVALNLPQTSNTRLWGISEDIEAKLSDSLTLKSLTAYRKSRAHSQQDGDATDQDLQQVRLGEDARQFSQEFNLIGRAEHLEYVVGLFYFDERTKTDSSITLPPQNARALFNPVTDTKAYAAYAQATYQLNDVLAIVAGGRYSHEKKDFTQLIDRRVLSTNAQGPITAYQASRTFSSFTPKIGINWTPTSDILVYVSATRGFKSGGFNFNSANATQGFDPETLWSYEAGVKSQFLDRRLQMNLTAFRYDYKNLQVNAFIRPGATDIVNAATARVNGAELEIVAKPVRGLDLTANFAVLDATYRRYPAAPIGGAATIDASGNRLNNAPKFTMNLAAQYTYPLAGGDSVYARGEYSRRSQSYFTVLNSPLIGQDAYDLVNASLGYTSKDGRWTAEVWGRNLGDEEYVVNVYTNGPVPSGIPGAPKTYGVRLVWNY